MSKKITIHYFVFRNQLKNIEIYYWHNICFYTTSTLTLNSFQDKPT